MDRTTRAPLGEKIAWGAGLLGGAALVLAAWFLRHVLLLLFAGVLLAVLLRTPADWLHRRTRLPSRLGVGLVALGSVLLLVAVFWLQGDAIGRQVTELREQLPRAIDRLRESVASTSVGQALLERLTESADRAVPGRERVLARAAGVLSTTVGAVASALLLLFLGLVLALTPKEYADGLVRLAPPDRRPLVARAVREMGRTLQWWLLGRLISMAAVGILTGIGLMILGVPLAFVLALIAALLSFIPNIGPVLSAIPAVLLGFVDGIDRALLVAGLYVAVQLVETNVLEPIIERKTVRLLPALTVAAQLSFGLVAGIGGLALASPIMAIVMVGVRVLYLEPAEARVQAR